MKLTPFILTLACLLASLHAEERFLLAADTQVIEINRAGKVTDILKHPRHIGIYDAWRLPDGGIAYAHRGGLAVFDSAHKLLLDHPARAGASGTETNSCAVLDGGSKFALMDSGACQIRVVDRSGSVISETPLPDLVADPLHFRYRMIRPVRGEDSFWVAQYARKTLLKVQVQTGKIQQTIPLEPLLKHTPTTKKAFAVLQSRDGSLFVSTSTGCQLLHLDESGKAQQCWTREDLGLSCRYLLGMSQLSNGNVLIACGDYHLQQPDEGRDLLAEISTDGKVIWRFTRDQLVDQIEGAVDPRTKLEEMRITHVHAYDSERLNQCLEVNR